MTGPAPAREEFGRSVVGPVLAEFCLGLWSFADSLVRTVDAGQGGLLPGAAAALSYEFSRLTLGRATEAIAGVPAEDHASLERPFDPDGFAELLRAPQGRVVAEALREQAGLFERHLREALGERHHAALVDTGLYGTTRQLLAEGQPDLRFSSPLLARSFRPGSGDPRAFGLSVEAEGYDPRRRRTALLRYWHFVEWLLEPGLASVRTFTEHAGRGRSNLEVHGWQRRVEPEPGSVLAGAMAYLDALDADAAARIVADADRAWSALHRAVVRPRPGDAHLLAVGERSHDFGLEGIWTARSWRGPVAVLRGSSMWREGEAAMAGPLRRPLLLALEAAHTVRWVRRTVLGRRTPARTSLSNSRGPNPPPAENDR